VAIEMRQKVFTRCAGACRRPFRYRAISVDSRSETTIQVQ
jgi:hypothetical protein